MNSSIVWLTNYIGSGEFTPHGFCLAWQPFTLWSSIVGDLLTFFAYIWMPAFILHYVIFKGYKIILCLDRELIFTYCILLFILLCGIGHLFSIIEIYIPIYQYDGIEKLLTGVVSIFTAGLISSFVKLDADKLNTLTLNFKIKRLFRR